MLKSETQILWQRMNLIRPRLVMSYLKAKCLTLLCDHFLFRDLPDPMDPLERMVDLVPMELWVLLVFVDPLDMLDLL